MERFNLVGEILLQVKNLPQVSQQVKTSLGTQIIDAKVSPKANAQLQKMEQNVNKTGVALNKASNEAKNFGDSIFLATRRQAAFIAGTIAFFKVAQAIKMGIGEAISFQHEMVRIGQVTGRTVGGLRQLQNQISTLSTTLGVSSTELVNVARILSQTGKTAGEVQKMIGIIAKTDLAPTFKDMATTTEGAIALMGQFGNAADETSRVGLTNLEDKLGAINAVSKKFAVESDDMVAVIRRAGGAFASAGGNVEELMAIFTTARHTTRRTAESISTGLRTITTRLQRARTQEFLQGMGIKTRDEQGIFVTPFETFKRISKAIKSGEIDTKSQPFADLVENLGGVRRADIVIPILKNMGMAMDVLSVSTKGYNSLNEDVITGLESMKRQLVIVKEEFLKLMRAIADDSLFKVMFQSITTLTKSLISLADAVKPVLPFLGAFLVLKGARIGGDFYRAARMRSLNTIAKGYSKGGIVDTMLTPGEYIFTPPETRRIGVRNLELMRKMSGGGMVAGVGDKDTVHKRLQAGSYVLPKRIVKGIGIENLERMKYMAAGGVVTSGRTFYGKQSLSGEKNWFDKIWEEAKREAEKADFDKKIVGWLEEPVTQKDAGKSFFDKMFKTKSIGLGGEGSIGLGGGGKTGYVGTGNVAKMFDEKVMGWLEETPSVPKYSKSKISVTQQQNEIQKEIQKQVVQQPSRQLTNVSGGFGQLFKESKDVNQLSSALLKSNISAKGLVQTLKTMASNVGISEKEFEKFGITARTMSKAVQGKEPALKRLTEVTKAITNAVKPSAAVIQPETPLRLRPEEYIPSVRGPRIRGERGVKVRRGTVKGIQLPRAGGYGEEVADWLGPMDKRHVLGERQVSDWMGGKTTISPLPKISPAPTTISETSPYWTGYKRRGIAGRLMQQDIGQMTRGVYGGIKGLGRSIGGGLGKVGMNVSSTGLMLGSLAASSPAVEKVLGAGGSGAVSGGLMASGMASMMGAGPIGAIAIGAMAGIMAYDQSLMNAARRDEAGKLSDSLSNLDKVVQKHGIGSSEVAKEFSKGVDIINSASKTYRGGPSKLGSAVSGVKSFFGSSAEKILGGDIFGKKGFLRQEGLDMAVSTTPVLKLITKMFGISTGGGAQAASAKSGVEFKKEQRAHISDLVEDYKPTFESLKEDALKVGKSFEEFAGTRSMREYIHALEALTPGIRHRLKTEYELDRKMELQLQAIGSTKIKAGVRTQGAADVMKSFVALRGKATLATDTIQAKGFEGLKMPGTEAFGEATGRLMPGLVSDKEVERLKQINQVKAVLPTLLSTTKFTKSSVGGDLQKQFSNALQGAELFGGKLGGRFGSFKSGGVAGELIEKFGDEFKEGSLGTLTEQLSDPEKFKGIIKKLESVYDFEIEKAQEAGEAQQALTQAIIDWKVQIQTQKFAAAESKGGIVTAESDLARMKAEFAGKRIPEGASNTSVLAQVRAISGTTNIGTLGERLRSAQAEYKSGLRTPDERAKAEARSDSALMLTIRETAGSLNLLKDAAGRTASVMEKIRELQQERAADVNIKERFITASPREQQRMIVQARVAHATSNMTSEQFRKESDVNQKAILESWQMMSGKRANNGLNFEDIIASVLSPKSKKLMEEEKKAVGIAEHALGAGKLLDENQQMILKQLNDGMGQFVIQAARLADQLGSGAIPSEITLTHSKINLDIVMNGVEVLQNIMPEIRGLIEQQIKDGINSFIQQKIPNLGPYNPQKTNKKPSAND